MAATTRQRKKQYSEGIATIKATFNNTMVTISTPSGDVLCQSSAGRSGFKNSRKGTPYAAQLTAETAANKAKEFGIKRVIVRVKGPGAGRDSAIRALNSAGLIVVSIADFTKLPHNGCRPKKERRV